MGRFIIKVLGSSALVAIAIKGLGSQLPITPIPSPFWVLVLVWGPTVGMGMALAWRSARS